MYHIFKNDVSFVLNNCSSKLLHKILCIIVLSFTLVFLHSETVNAMTVSFSKDDFIDLTAYESIEVSAYTPYTTGCTTSYFPSGTMGSQQSALTCKLVDQYGTVTDTITIGGGWVPSGGDKSILTSPTSGYFDVRGLTGSYKIVVITNTVSLYDYDGTLEALITKSASSSLASIKGTMPDAPICDTNLA